MIRDSEYLGGRPLRFTWHEVAYVALSISVVLLAAGAGYNFYVLFGQSTSDTERWMVTLTTAFANLCAALIAYLTAREVRLNDADKKIQKADLDRALSENKECKDDRKKLHDEQKKMQRRIERLMRKNQLDEEDDEGDDDQYVERRGEPDPNYSGPLRRKDDKKTGSKQYRKLPPNHPPET